MITTKDRITTNILESTKQKKYKDVTAFWSYDQTICDFILLAAGSYTLMVP